MIFEVGKFYRNYDGEEMAILGMLNTYLYGSCLIAESNRMANLKPVGGDEVAAQGWFEITEAYWLRNFS